MAKKCTTCKHRSDDRCDLLSRPGAEGNDGTSLAYTTDYDGWASYLYIADPNKFYCFHWVKKEATNG